LFPESSYAKDLQSVASWHSSQQSVTESDRPYVRKVLSPLSLLAILSISGELESTLASRLLVVHAAYEVVVSKTVRTSKEVVDVKCVVVWVRVEVEIRVVDKEMVDDTEGASVEFEVSRIVLVVLV
jgi:hypothetical protein